MRYINNAFSTKMLKDETSNLTITRIGYKQFKKETKEAISYIGHKKTAKLFNLAYNRETLCLMKGDILYVIEVGDTRNRALEERDIEKEVINYLKIEILTDASYKKQYGVETCIKYGV